MSNGTGAAGNPTLALANDLAALEGLSGTGLVARTASETFVERSLTAPAAGITITNPAGIAGNPTFALANDLAALEGMAGTGIVVRTAAETYAQRTIAVTDSSSVDFTITNADGTGGNPTITAVVLPAGVDHGGLGGLTDDDHTQYLLLAGRSGGQTANGGTTTANSLTLNANDQTFAITNTGRIVLGGRITSSVTGNLTTAMSATEGVLAFSGTTTASASGTVYNLAAVLDSRVLSYSVAQAFSFAPTFAAASVFTSTASVTDTSTVYTGFWSAPKATLATAAVTTTTPLLAGYIANPSVQQTNGTALNVTNVAGFASGYGSGVYFPLAVFDPTINRSAGTLTITNWRHFHATDPYTNGTYTLTTQVGVDIDALTKGTTNIGLRNAATEVCTPSTAQIVDAATDTILANASTVQINNNTGASITLTSTPHIADGQNGQRLTIINVGASNVVFRDQSAIASNLRLAGAANLTLGTNDAVTLEFNSTIGDWVRVGGSDN